MERCECGSKLPTHLAEIAGDEFSHTCSCGAHFKVKDGKFVREGSARNPFADYDNKVAEYMKKHGVTKPQYYALKTMKEYGDVVQSGRDRGDFRSKNGLSPIIQSKTMQTLYELGFVSFSKDRGGKGRKIAKLIVDV